MMPLFIPLLSMIGLISAAADYTQIAIIGGGVAGYSAALYAGNARVSARVFVGPRPGGQLLTAGFVENMPGIEAQPGLTIIERLEKQAESFGTHIKHDAIIRSVRINNKGARFTLTDQQGHEYNADALVLATGARPNTLGVPGESEYWGRGVSTCALCDGIFTKDKNVVVIGGGDAAIEEVLQLAPYAQHITLLLRGDSFKASSRMQEKLLQYSTKYGHISVRYGVEVTAILGKHFLEDHQPLTGIELRNKVTGQTEVMATDAVFLAIGQTPETAFIADIVPCDSQGYVILKSGQQTCVEGIFAAGDVADRRYRQAIVASGDGAKAALDAIAYLRHRS